MIGAVSSSNRTNRVGETVKTFKTNVLSDGGNMIINEVDIQKELYKLVEYNFDFINIPSAQKTGLVYSQKGEDLVFARASEATYFSSDGNMKLSLNNEPRLIFDPKHKVYKGLLVESGFTNTIHKDFSSTWVLQDITSVKVPDTKLINEFEFTTVDLNAPTTTRTYLTSAVNPSDTDGYFTFYIKHLEGPAAYVGVTKTGGSSVRIYLDGSNATSDRVFWEDIGDGYLRVGGKLGTTANSVVQILFRQDIESESFGNKYLISLPQFQEGNTVSSDMPVYTTARSRDADLITITDPQTKNYLGASVGTIYYEKDGSKIAEVYSGGNKLVYQNGVLSSTTLEGVPASVQLSSGIYKAICMKQTNITEQEAIAITT